MNYIQVKLDWPLSFKRLLLHHVQRDASEKNVKLDSFADVLFDPKLIIKQTHRFSAFIPTVALVERQYGSGVASIFHLQIGFFLINLLTLILWLAVIIIPYKVFDSSTKSSNVSFSFASIFTTNGYLSESILFQGSYPSGVIGRKYNLSLWYFVTTYIYFFIWFIFITIRFATAYKRKIFDSILNAKLGTGFMCTFARYNFTVRTEKDKQKYMANFLRQYRDFMGNDERIKETHSKKFQTFQYKFKMVVTYSFYIVLAIAFGEKTQKHFSSYVTFYLYLLFSFLIQRWYQLVNLIFM